MLGQIEEIHPPIQYEFLKDNYKQEKANVFLLVGLVRGEPKRIMQLSKSNMVHCIVSD